MMDRICLFFGYIDGIGIVSMMHTRKLLRDWLGCPRCVFERGFIVAYLTLCCAGLAMQSRSYWEYWCMPVFLFITWGMWRDHRATNRVRFLRMLSIPASISRGFLCFWMIANVLLTGMLPPRGLKHMMIPLGYVAYVFFQFAACLPTGGDEERGKRAKLAAEKLKALFGTSWQTDPLPRPV